MRQMLVFIGLCALAATAQGDPPGDLALVPVVTGGIGSPIAIRNAGDGTNRLFILGRNGQIWIKPAASGTVLTPPFLNIGAGGTPPPFGLGFSGEGGLLGLAFHPNYETNRRFYIGYTDTNNDTVIVRYTAQAANPSLADTASAQVVLRVDQDSAFHKGGDLQFGPDGFLYIALGDGAGGSGIDACQRAQTLRPAQLDPPGQQSDCQVDANFTSTGGNGNSRALLGKILRIDVDATTPAGANELCASSAGGSANYAIPASNPFAGTAVTAGNCDEIWAYGLRNPFRFSFDRTTGDMFIGDVGESAVEEVNFQAAGTLVARNYGWPQCEGNVGSCGSSIAPILTYTHASNAGPCASITGGFRYRGNILGFGGTYVFSDYCSGKVRFGTFSGSSWSFTQFVDGPDLQHTSFGEDEAGELYLAEINGDRILKFSSAAVDVVFRNDFE